MVIELYWYTFIFDKKLEVTVLGLNLDEAINKAKKVAESQNFKLIKVAESEYITFKYYYPNKGPSGKPN